MRNCSFSRLSFLTFDLSANPAEFALQMASMLIARRGQAGLLDVRPEEAAAALATLAGAALLPRDFPSG